MASFGGCIDRFPDGARWSASAAGGTDPESGAWDELAVEDRLWQPGQRLRVRFLDGSDGLRDRVLGHARGWLDVVNLELAVVEDGAAEIRVSFLAPGNWSYVGTDALRITDPDAPTMNFGGWTDETDDPTMRPVVLHLVGHALGFDHEHAPPGEPIPWDRDALLAQFGGAPTYWDWEQIQHNVIDRYSVGQSHHTSADPASSLRYPIPATLTGGRMTVGWNDDLSDGDRRLAAKAYPRLPAAPAGDGAGDGGGDGAGDGPGDGPGDGIGAAQPTDDDGGWAAFWTDEREGDAATDAALPPHLMFLPPVEPPAEDWLVSEEDRFTTPYRYEGDRNRVRPVELVVIHYTASPWTPGDHAGSDRTRQERWLSGTQKREASTHFDVLRDGLALQGAPLRDRTWHAGGSVWAFGGRRIEQINHRAIGLDFDNAGRLYPVRGGFVDAYESAAMKKEKRGPRRFYLGPEPFEDERGRFWEPYTDAAILTVMRLLAQLADLFPILRDAPERLVGHEHVRSTKPDPGPALPWDLLRQAVQTPLEGDVADATIDWSSVPGVVRLG